MAQENGESAASHRAVELFVAALVLAFGLLVAWDSRRIGASWGEDGPQPGYFPFHVGVLICLSALVVLVRALRRADGRSFVSRGQLSLILVVLLPTVVYVAAVPWLGLYVASTLYIAFFMRRLGRYAWWKTAAVSAGVSVVFFLVFETWFKVPLPKGPLEAALGLN